MKKLLSTWGSLHREVVILLIINFIVYERVSRPFPTDSSPKHSDSLRNLCPQGMEDKGGHGWVGSMEVCQSGRLKFGNWGEGIESQINCCCADVLSRGQLFATPWTVACQIPLSMEFSRQEYWNGLPFPSPGDLCHPRIEPRSPALSGFASVTQCKVLEPGQGMGLTASGF